jgi:dipeptidase
VQHGNGRIDHNLRRIVIERARTAREAVKIAGKIVERYGYASSGRVYSIADPNEAWVFEVANGKHWIARRVPDDGVVIIPNYYVIDGFHESDTANFLASADMFKHAIANGWYDPHTDTSFNFRKVYGHTNRLDAIWNIARKWVIINQLGAQQYDFYTDFPFSIEPKHKIDIQMLIDALGNHYEGTRFASDTSLTFGSPHRRSGLAVNDTLTVCNLYNDFSCIIQLRNWLPAEIGNVLWISPRYPCFQPFIPWYYGIKKISSEYEKATYADALENYNNRNRNYIELYPDHACWVYDDFANSVDSCYNREIESVREWKSKVQTDVFETVKEKEAKALSTYESDRDGAVQVVTELSTSFAKRALNETKERLVGMRRYGR